jgi:hypothetical protein
VDNSLRELVDGLANNIGQGGDSVSADHLVFEVLPQGDAVLTADFLEAGEGVATLSAEVAEGTGTDFAFLNLYAYVVLGEVVVQEQLGVL